jgi:hypothetical protein
LSRYRQYCKLYEEKPCFSKESSRALISTQEVERTAFVSGDSRPSLAAFRLVCPMERPERYFPVFGL